MTTPLMRYLEQLVLQATQRSCRPLMVHVGAWVSEQLVEELGQLPDHVDGASFNEFRHTIPAADEVVIETRPYKAGRGGDWTDELFRVRLPPRWATAPVLEVYEVLRKTRGPEQALAEAEALDAS